MATSKVGPKVYVVSERHEHPFGGADYYVPLITFNTKKAMEAFMVGRSFHQFNVKVVPVGQEA